MTWTQPVCDNRFRMLYPDKQLPHRLILDDEDTLDRCCFCRRPALIYVRLDPSTVPYPREE